MPLLSCTDSVGSRRLATDGTGGDVPSVCPDRSRLLAGDVRAAAVRYLGDPLVSQEAERLDGRVGRYLVDLGEVVGAGKPLPGGVLAGFDLASQDVCDLNVDGC